MRVCVTGLMDLQNETDVINNLYLELKTYKAKYSTAELISSFSPGVDLHAVKIGLELNFHIKIFLPEHPSLFFKRYSNAHYQEFQSLSQQLEIIILPEQNSNFEDKLIACAELMLSKSDLLIALWDGRDSMGKGGTADVIKLARERSLDIKWIIAFRKEIYSLYKELDYKSKQLKFKYEIFWMTSIFLAFISSLILFAALSFKFNYPIKIILSRIEFGMISAFITIIICLRVFNLNRNRLHIRLCAEYSRLLNVFYRSGMPIDFKFGDFINHPLPEMLKTRYECFKLIEFDSEFSLNEINTFINEQLEYHISRLNNHLKPTLHKLEHFQSKLIYAFAFFALFHSFLFGFYSDYLNSIGIKYFYQTSLFITLIAPALYALIEGYIYFKDFHSLRTQSELKIDYLNEKISQIKSCKVVDYSFLKLLTTDIGKRFIIENKEWYGLKIDKISPGI